MSYTTLVTDTTWGSSPIIYLSIAYDYKREGASMLYKIKVYDIKLQYSSSWFGYPIKGYIYLDGGNDSAKRETTIKNASPSQWDSLSWETDWMWINNKTSGTTALTVKLESSSEGRSKEYEYNLPVIAAAVKIKQVELDPLDEQGNFYEDGKITVTPDSDHPDNYILEYCISKDGSSADITSYNSNSEIDLKNANKDILYKAIPNATTFRPYIYLRTRVNNTTIGYDKQQITVNLIPKQPFINITNVTNGINTSRLKPEYISKDGKTYIYTSDFIPTVSYDYTIYNYGNCRSITINNEQASTTTKQYVLNTIPDNNRITAQVTDSRGWQSDKIINEDYIFIKDYFIPTFYWKENPTFIIGTDADTGNDTVKIKGTLNYNIPDSWNNQGMKEQKNQSFKYEVYDSKDSTQILETGQIEGPNIETDGITYNPNSTYTIKIIYSDDILKENLSIIYSGNPMPIFDFGASDFNFNVPLYYQNEPMDFVVEQGTDDIWTYRKWYSGIAECWGRIGSQSYAITSTYGTWYYALGNTISLPSGLFKTITCATSNRCGGTTANGLVTTNVSTISTTGLKYFIYDGKSETLDIDVALSVKGTWK